MRDTRAARDIREDGNAIVEFIMMMVVLVIPALYIVVTLASVQAAAFASESASREAARLLSADPQRTEFASQQAHVTFAEFGLPAPESVTTRCDPSCSTSGALLTVTVSTTVPLPLIPSWIGARGVFPVSSTTQAVIEGVRIE